MTSLNHNHFNRSNFFVLKCGRLGCCATAADQMKIGGKSGRSCDTSPDQLKDFVRPPAVHMKDNDKSTLLTQLEKEAKSREV